MTQEIGTLRELNVHRGDVVESLSDQGWWTKGKHYKAERFDGEIAVLDDEGDDHNHNSSAPFRLISRADDAEARS